jgi:hypothetical protein
VHFNVALEMGIFICKTKCPPLHKQVIPYSKKKKKEKKADPAWTNSDYCHVLIRMIPTPSNNINQIILTK